MIKLNSLTRNSAILLILSVISSFLSYIGQIVMGRNLTSDSFGTINAIFSVLVIVSVPATALTTFITKKAAEKANNILISSSLSKALRYLVTSSGLIFLISLIIAPLIASILGLRSSSVLIISILMVIMNFLTPIHQGALAGLQKFFALGLLALLSPLGRLVAALIAPANSGNDIAQQNTILSGIIIGTMLSIIIGCGILRHSGIKYQPRKSKIISGVPLARISEYSSLLFINIGLMFFMNIDILMVRYFFGGEIAGNYSSMQLFARIAHYVSAALTVVMMPMVVKRHRENKNPFSLLKLTLIYTSISTIVVCLPIILYTNQIIDLLFGSKYIVERKIMLLSCLVVFVFSLISAIANYMIGIGKSKKLAFFLGFACAIAFALMFVFNSNINQMLISLIFSGFTIFLICLFYCIYIQSKLYYT